MDRKLSVMAGQESDPLSECFYWKEHEQAGNGGREKEERI